jgi:hypothetical protein
LGLTHAGGELIKELAQNGILIDMAHMSANAMDDTLNLQWLMTARYPLMDSHTGLRMSGEKAENERALMRSHAQRIGELGGVIGLGTEGASAQEIVLLKPDGALRNPGTPLVRFTAQHPDQTWKLKRLAANPVVTHLTVKIKTGNDDLRGGNNGAFARVKINERFHLYNLSNRNTWAGGSMHTVTIELPGGTKLNQIASFTLRATPNGKNSILDTADNWDVKEIKVEATFSGLDPVAQWMAEYKTVLALLNGQGAAIGTDLNGFAPQIPFSANPVTYPFNIASRIGNRPSGYMPPDLARSRMGQRTFDFKNDGIAHYGMLADFMQALSQQPDSRNVLDKLFLSANDVVEMWEKCEDAAAYIQ